MKLHTIIHQYIPEATPIDLESMEHDFFSYYKVQTDSRACDPRSFFVPLQGERFDGHQFISEAISRGCAGYFYEPEKHTPKVLASCSPVAVPNILSAYQVLGHVYRKTVLVQTKLVAISGSCGKTTVKELLKITLSRFGSVSATLANENNEIGVVKTILNTPADTDFLICEMGMRNKNDLERLVWLASPNISVLTCVTESHLSCVTNIDEVYEGKMRLFSSAPEAYWLGPANDSKIMAQLLTHPGRHKSFCFTTDTNDRFPAMGSVILTDYNIDFNRLETQVVAQLDHPQVFTQQQKISLSVSSIHSKAAENLAITLGCAMILLGGKVLELHGKKLVFPGIDGRYQLWRAKGVRLIDDAYNACPLSMRSGLFSVFGLCAQLLLSHSPLQLTLVLGDMLELGDREELAHFELGGWIKAHFHTVIHKIELSFILCGPLSSDHLSKGLGDEICHAATIHSFRTASDILTSPQWDKLAMSLHFQVSCQEPNMLPKQHVVFLKASHGSRVHQLTRDLLTKTPELQIS
ncbi:MAG: UDP-N-acetylmuramoyl-tripeptide--D-alanyl-D-alanine ligase [Proteobacteria bacterium]|nr:UDP-N-acetylmuramoyl-tripeptide--D-alanyl-D-alanine ligase [Pseudomonadota bacterium]